MATSLNSFIQNIVLRANRLQHEYISIELIFAELLEEQSIRALLELLDVEVKELQAEMLDYLNASSAFSRLTLEEMENKGREQFSNLHEYDLAKQAGFYFQPSFTDDSQELFNHVALHMQSSNKEWNPYSLFVALYEFTNSYAVFLLYKYDVDKSDVLELLTDKLDPPLTDQHEDEKEKKDVLNRYCIDMLDHVPLKDPLIGRLSEKKRIFQILARKTKNNALIVGEAGVGKTALAYGIAADIIQKRSPELFYTYKMFMLDISAIIAGTKYRGDFEKRLKQVFLLLEKIPEDVILFIDELHTVMGLGATGEGNLDFSNLLKPILEQGKIRCIGSTTFDEYRRFIEKDHAFARRFQKIDILEPSAEETEKILYGLKSRYENFHNITYSNAILKKIVVLTGKYLLDRNYPDKAIDLVDEVGARNRIKPVQRRKKSITIRDVEQVIAEIAKLPQDTMEKNEKEQLLELKQALQRQIFGQNRVIEHIVDAIILAKSPFAIYDKPVAQFLFVGPTGVGKTELAKQLANGLGIPFLRYDMSEFMEKHAVAKLIGAPPGYVGYEQGGSLTDDIKKKPHAVLLLDEIEKAHVDILNILLQVMDHGVLTDSKGRETDFRNIIIIMTSNIGAHEAAGSSIGLQNTSGKEFLREKRIKSFFTPEFRNRLTAIEYFQPLSEEALLKVVGKNVHLLRQGLQKQNIRLEVTDSAQRFVLEKSVSKEFGARNIKRYMDQEVGMPIAKALLTSSGGKYNFIIVDVEDNNLKFTYR